VAAGASEVPRTPAATAEPTSSEFCGGQVSPCLRHWGCGAGAGAGGRLGRRQTRSRLDWEQVKEPNWGGAGEAAGCGDFYSRSWVSGFSWVDFFQPDG